MQPSIFNVRVPLPERNEVFLMNTFSDAQLLVSPDVADLLDSLAAREASELTAEEQGTLAELAEHGFIAQDRESERRRLNEYFHEVREDTDQLRVTVMTTLQCNFACDYCFQGDHGDHNKHAEKMSMETARELGDWIEERLDTLRSGRLSLTFFGGEPLLNMPVVYYLAERVWTATRARGVDVFLSIITNGLLLTPEVVDRLLPYGLGSVKITLDGDRDMHNKMRPLRGGQGTFDKIVRNLQLIAGKLPIAIGGNFDMESAETYPALLDFLKEQSFADSIAKVFVQTDHPDQAGTVAAEGLPAADGSRRQRQADGRQHVHDVGRGRRLGVRHLPFRGREDVVPAGGDEAAGLRHDRRRPHGSLRNPQAARLHRRPRGLALRLPGVHGRARPGGRAHPRPARGPARGDGGPLRSSGCVEELRRLLVHPGVRRRMFRLIARRTR